MEYFTLDTCYYGDAHVHTAFSKDAFMAHTFMYVGPLSKYGDVVRDPWYAYEYAMDVTELDWVAINDHAEAQPNSHLATRRAGANSAPWSCRTSGICTSSRAGSTHDRATSPAAPSRAC